ncbi:TIGR04255 family protein [Alteromonadaceae bacterium BrNp21-10]|nr:TIGR04255 family protein [Alteromonadaceae bacterium BrNp21-10]
MPHNFRKLVRQPLVSVLMEVRFSTVLSLEKYIPDIQDAVRKEYPFFGKEKEHGVAIEKNGLRVNQTDKFVFWSKEKNSAFHITPERLVFITTSYDRFEGFSKRCSFLISVLADIVSPALYSRLGLRYSDCIVTQNNDESELFELCQSKDMFFPEPLNELGKKVVRKTESALETEIGLLVLRTQLGVMTQKVLDDLLPQNYVEIKDDELPSLRLLLDFDHFWEKPENQKDFNVNAVLEQLEKLHQSSRSAFWDITSTYAKENVWA